MMLSSSTMLRSFHRRAVGHHHRVEIAQRHCIISISSHFADEGRDSLLFTVVQRHIGRTFLDLRQHQRASVLVVV